MQMADTGGHSNL